MACLLKFKDGVKVPRTVIIAAAVINTANSLEVPTPFVWVTSGNDSTHMKGSKHYSDQALDIRTHDWDANVRRKFVLGLKQRLGADYDVILEDEGGPNEHCHAEYDKKGV